MEAQLSVRAILLLSLLALLSFLARSSSQDIQIVNAERRVSFEFLSILASPIALIIRSFRNFCVIRALIHCTLRLVVEKIREKKIKCLVFQPTRSWFFVLNTCLFTSKI